MMSPLRKSALIIKRIADLFERQVSAPKHSRKEIQQGPGPVAVNAIASTPVYPVCHVCGVAAGIRNTADILNGNLAGECMSCGALRPVE